MTVKNMTYTFLALLSMTTSIGCVEVDEKCESIPNCRLALEILEHIDSNYENEKLAYLEKRKLVELSFDAIPALYSVIENPNKVVSKIIAIEVLGEMKHPESFGLLKKLAFENPSINTRVAALNSIIMIDCARAVKELKGFVERESNSYFRRATAKYLRNNSCSDSFEILEILSSDPNNLVRKEAYTSLFVKFGDRCLSLFRKRLQIENDLILQKKLSDHIKKLEN